MRNRAAILFRGGGFGADGATAATTAAARSGDDELTLEVFPPMSPRDEAIFLLHTAAEIEHSLMVQYLYASWSLRGDGPENVQRWRRSILEIAREEMAHFASVQNLLRFVGGPLNFDREDFPFRSDFYPFPFQLERLDRDRLARYVAAEMPAAPEIAPDLLARILRLASDDGRTVNRVGALYKRLSDLLSDKQALPDDVFRPDSADHVQALPARFRADVGRGPLFLRVVRNREEALSLLADVANQGEGERSMPDSHFLTFVDIFDGWPKNDSKITLDVPTHPNTTLAENGDDPVVKHGRITHPRALEWAVIVNHHYRMLLVWLQHALLMDTVSAASPGLSLRVFDEMFALSDVGQLLTTLPRTKAGKGRAGAPFELPYSLAFPDQPGDQWEYHRDLLATARAQLEAVAVGANDAEEQVRRRLLASVAAGEEFVREHADDAGAGGAA